MRLRQLRIELWCTRVYRSPRLLDRTCIPAWVLSVAGRKRREAEAEDKGVKPRCGCGWAGTVNSASLCCLPRATGRHVRYGISPCVPLSLSFSAPMQTGQTDCCEKCSTKLINYGCFQSDRGAGSVRSSRRGRQLGPDLGEPLVRHWWVILLEAGIGCASWLNFWQCRSEHGIQVGKNYDQIWGQIVCLILVMFLAGGRK